MSEGNYDFSMQSKIETAVTNGIGFKDASKWFSTGREINTLIALRSYLCSMESNVSLNTRNPRRFFVARNYLDSLLDMAQERVYHKQFDLNTPEGIDDALKERAERVMRDFRTMRFDAA